MKKHYDRPALRVIEVWRWIEKGILEIEILKDTPIFHLSQGKSVRQRWLRKTKRDVKVKSAITYLRKGIFLVPSWRKVSDWEIKYLLDHGISLTQAGIAFVKPNYQRLCYMQVEDLDHTHRQQNHILVKYLNDLLAANFPELMEKLARQNRIIQEISIRQIGADNLSKKVHIRLDSISRSLRSFLKHAPIFKPNFSEIDKQTVSNYLRKAAQECRQMTMRPISRQLGYAARSMELAALHIQNGRLILAKARLKSALKNLEYPTET